MKKIFLRLTFLLIFCTTLENVSASTITFNTNGGSLVTEQTLAAGKKLAYPGASTREGYLFAGWYDNANLSGLPVLFPYSTANNVTLYAKWLSESDFMDGNKRTQFYPYALRNSLFRSDARIVDIALLGAHDAFTDQIASNSPLDPGDDNYNSLKLIDWIAGATIANGAKAQAEGAYNLARYGVRFFDTRVCYYNNTWWTMHAKISQSLDTYLKGVLQFLDETDREFVVIYIWPQSSVHLNGASYASLWSYIENVRYNGKNIFDYIQYKNISLSKLTYGDVVGNSSHSGVVLFTLDPSAAAKGGYSTGSDVRCTWHDKSNSDDLLTAIQNEYTTIKSGSYNNRMRICQAQRTSGSGGNLLNMANEFNYRPVDDSRFETWLTAMPVVWFDNAATTIGNFNMKINRKMHLFNLSTGNAALPAGTNRYYVKKNGKDTNSGLTWNEALASPAVAISKLYGANANCEVWIAEGEYSVSNIQTGVNAATIVTGKIYGGFSGTENSLAERKINTTGTPWSYARKTILKANGNLPVLQINNQAIPAIIDGLIFDGNATAPCISYRQPTSAGIFRNCVFQNGNGSNWNGSANLIVDSGQYDWASGGINIGTDRKGDGSETKDAGYPAENAIVTVENCLIANNTGRLGGGVFSKGGKFINCIIRNNHAVNLGTYKLPTGIGTFTSNLTTSGNGGGVFFGKTNADDVNVLINCIVSNNTADGKGGGVYTASSTADIFNSTLASNKSAANGGGGIFIAFRTKVYNAIFYDNKASRSVENVNRNNTALLFYNNITDALPDGITGSQNILCANRTQLFAETVTYTPANSFIGRDHGATSGISGLPATDLAGNTRTISILDIGPYETVAEQPNGLQDFTDDPVIETKYYNLQGWEMQRPLQEGIFIVKRKHASERIEVIKVYGRP